jgi:NAD(P)-dependent dehydrogenase (short-subunit alcohol dehydrogenase family)
MQIERRNQVGILEKMRLDGKAIFVTGGATGLGYSMATALAEAGANILIADIDLPAAKKAAAELSSINGNKMLASEVDISNPDDVNCMVDLMLEEFGKIDVAFCNAGISKANPIEKESFEDWKEVIDVNLNGTFLCAQAAGKVMLNQGYGSIIITASMSAHIVNIPQTECSYAASKAAIKQMTKNMAIEWASRGVRVNSISPGYMATKMTLMSPELKPLIGIWEELSPLHRMGKPEELQSIAVYLAGDTSSFTTGADFLIDGAYTCF